MEQLNDLNVRPDKLTAEDYESYLINHNIEYTTHNYYHLAGPAPTTDDKAIYISVVISQIPRFLDAILPYLSTIDTSFICVKDKHIAAWILAGNYGIDYTGKVFVVYPSNTQNFNTILHKIADLTKHLKGTKIPDKKQVGTVVFIDPDQKELKSHQKNSSRIIQNRYLILSYLKRDDRGDVTKCFYMKNLFNMGFCLVKEGRKNMWSDEVGRDVVDRLKWQQTVHKELGEIIKIPAIIDLFEEKDSSYLVMEFINGKSLSEIVELTYENRTWYNLSKSEKQKILDLLLRILDMVDKMHRKGYVHRDLTPANFIVTVKNELFAIDLELAYHISKGYPSPPFQVGSYGFASPEQKNVDTPTVKEDIYAIGALMCVCLTNIRPSSLDFEVPDSLVKSILHFTHNQTIADLISRCFAHQADERPNLEEIIDEIKKTKDTVLRGPELNHEPDCQLPQPIEITHIVEKALEGLKSYNMNRDGALFTRNCITGIGLTSPITTILYSIYHLKILHRQPELMLFFKTYIQRYSSLFYSDNRTYHPGLFYGSAGAAIFYQYSELTNLSSNHLKDRRLQDRNFNIDHDGLDLANGAAGQLFAAIEIYKFDQTGYLKGIISDYENLISSAQSNDGSWLFKNTGKNESIKITGLVNGSSGIILALIEYDKYFPTTTTKKVIEKGMNYLMSIKINAGFSLDSGLAGIVLTFLYAYEHFKNPLYKKKTEEMLNSFPKYTDIQDYSLSSGFAGYGLVYIEAARILQSREWESKAVQIYEIFKHRTIHITESGLFWNSNNTYPEYDSSLDKGSSGIILFLLKMLQYVEHRKLN